MDDFTRIIIDSANFNRNMPKWSTEETLKRCLKILDESNKGNKKSLDSIYKIIKQLSNQTATQDKEENKDNKDIKKSNEQIVKILGQIRTDINNTKKSSSTSSSSSNKPSNNNDIIKSNSKISDNISELENTVRKTSDDQIDVLNSIRSNTTKSLSQMEEILYELKGIRRNPSSSSPNISDSQGAVDMSATNAILNEINNSIDSTHTLLTGLYNKSPSTDDMKAIMAEQARYITRNISMSNSHSMNSLISNFNTQSSSDSSSPNIPTNNSSNNISHHNTGIMNKLLGKFGNIGEMIARGIRMTPIGKALIAAQAGLAAATKSFEYANDVQDEFLGMVNSGYNFGQTRNTYGTDRLDGIQLRSIITSNNVTLEAATEVLKDNARMVNELGFGNVFGEIGTVLGGTGPNSLPNTLGMTRDSISAIVGDFYSLSRETSDLTEGLERQDRIRYAREFVTNIRNMSQAIGVSTDDIRENIKSFSNNTNFRAASLTMDADETFNTRNAGALLQSALPENIATALQNAITSPLGLATDGAYNAIAEAFQGTDIPSIIMQNSEDINNMRNMNNQQQLEFVKSLYNQFQESTQEAVSSGRYEALRVTNPEAAANIQTLMANANQILNANSLTDLNEQTSPLVQLRQQITNLGQYTSAAIENIFAEAANSTSGRAAIRTTLNSEQIAREGMLALVENTGEIVSQLLNGIIPNILRDIKYYFGKVIDFLNIFNFGSDNSEENMNTSTTRTFMKNIMGEFNSSNSIFDIGKNQNGIDSIGLREGVDSDTAMEYLKGLYDNATNDEDRKHIITMVKGISRGFNNKEGEVTKEAEELMDNIRDNFLNYAGNINENMFNFSQEVKRGREDTNALIGRQSARKTSYWGYNKDNNGNIGEQNLIDSDLLNNTKLNNSIDEKIRQNIITRDALQREKEIRNGLKNNSPTAFIDLNRNFNTNEYVNSLSNNLNSQRSNDLYEQSNRGVNRLTDSNIDRETIREENRRVREDMNERIKNDQERNEKNRQDMENKQYYFMQDQNQQTGQNGSVTPNYNDNDGQVSVLNNIFQAQNSVLSELKAMNRNLQKFENSKL